MGLLSFFFGNDNSDESIAEDYLRSDCDETHISALVRHYPVSEANSHIEQFTGVRITDSQAAKLVQKIRDEYDLGAIDAYNMPGYVDPDDYPEDQEDQRAYNEERAMRDEEVETERPGGFWGWLFG